MENEEVDADQLFEGRNYRAARDRYRSAAMRAVPSATLFYNMHLALELDELEFLESISAQYPSDLECQLAYVTALIEQRGAARAINHCNDLLDHSGYSILEITKIRFLRLRANLLLLSSPDMIIDDITAAWITTEELPDQTAVKRAFLVEIAKIATPKMTSMLDNLVRDIRLPELVRCVVAAKLTELQAIAEIGG